MNTPTNLNQLIQYQESAVVSREIIKKPSGSVTLFAFDKGQGLSEHTTPYDAMVLVVDGVAAVTVNGHEYEVNTGETLIMPANVAHAVQANQCFKMMLTMIKS